MNSKALAKNCVEVAMQIAKNNLARHYLDVRAVCLQVPSEPADLIAILDGAGRTKFALTLLHGPEAQKNLDSWMLDQGESALEGSTAEYLGVGIMRMKELDPRFLRILERAGYPPSRLAPVFLVRSGREELRPPRREELETILYAMRGLQLAAGEGPLEGSYDIGVLPRILVAGDLRKPEIRIEYLDLASGESQSRESFRARPGYVDPMAMPPADDLEAWTAADLEVLSKLVEEGFAESRQNKKALRLYFGDVSPHLDLESDPDLEIMSYFEWFMTECRAGAHEPTILERVLEYETRPAYRAVLEAHQESWASIFLVRGALPGSHVDVVDLISGREHRIDDGQLAMGVEDGLLIVMRAYRVGDFLFGKPLGPVLPASWDIEMFEELERVGLEDSPEAYQTDMHLLGRLWEFSERMTETYEGRAFPEVVNTDGHPLLLHKASFSLANPEEWFAYCERRGDELLLVDDNEWTWLREDATCLGSLELLDDHLLLDVNSAKRYEAARGWLEKIPGVRFESLTTRDLGPATWKDLPLDDRLPDPPQPELPPEAMDALEEMLHKQYMSWLDEEIPALGGKTPRETCATQEGRRKVRRMILGYRDSPGFPSVPVPREAMLKELGLEPDLGE